jgi:hypothetical protein
MNKMIMLGGDEISVKDSEAINWIVAEALSEMGIDASSFAWHIEVEYTEEVTQ